MNYYIEKDNKIVMFDSDRQRLEDTLWFTSQYKNLEIKETDAEIINKDGEFVFKDDVIDELLKEAKDAKYQEANTGARAYLESGEALFELTPSQHIEATDGNIGKLGAYAMSFLTGLIKPDDVVYWNTKEDETIALTQEQLSTVLMGLGAVQAQVWNERFPAYKAQIEACETVEEVEAIEIDYSAQPPEESTENKESENV